MTDVKHTPGPWRWNGENALVGPDYAPVLEAGDNGASYGMHIPRIEHHWDKAVAEANRRLIAAAPCMLAALEAHDAYMLDAGYSGPEDTALHPRAAANWRAARAAIAKARGHD